MTQREFFSIVLSGDITDEALTYAETQLASLDKRNAARAEKVAEKRLKEHKPIIDAAAEYLAEHPNTLSTDLAAALSDILAIDISSPKVCGVLRNCDMFTNKEVAVKGKGKQKAWLLMSDAPAAED